MAKKKKKKQKEELKKKVITLTGESDRPKDPPANG